MLKQINIDPEKQMEEMRSKLKPIQIQEKIVKKPFPKNYQKIQFQMDGESKLLKGKVVNRHKPTSIYKDIVVVQFDDGSTEEINFAKDVVKWSDSQDVSEEVTNETFATVLTKAQVAGRPDTEEAIRQELKKFEDFSAFKLVDDKGQYAIKTRWVFTEHEDESKGYKLKSRLCMRGDTEENIDHIRADSPTTHKDSLKLALSIAANEGFDITSADIKSAFLQGKTLDREVYVIPPAEANQKGKLWLLQKGAYGLLDGSRLFYLQLKDKLEQLGLKQVSGDPAMFTYHKDGKLQGIVCLHVDDLLLMGKECFKNMVPLQLFNMFKFSKVEENQFKYLGCQIQKQRNGDICLNQNEYIRNIADVDCPARRNNSLVQEKERREIRRVVGELLWVSLMTRPDLSFEVNQLSTNICSARVKELKDAKRLVEKAKMEPVTLTFTKLGPVEKMRIRT